MGLRGERVNQLIRREISDYLHVRYRAESTCLTILAARISPDLRTGTVVYSVLGDEEQIEQAANFFKAKAGSAHAHLINRFLARDIGAFVFGSHCTDGLQKDGRFTNPRIPADKKGGTWYKPATTRTVQFGDAAWMRASSAR